MAAEMLDVMVPHILLVVVVGQVLLVQMHPTTRLAEMVEMAHQIQLVVLL
jgi:hypothetical protein